MKGKQSTKKINSLMKKLNWRMTPPPPVNLKKLIFITTNWPKMMMRGVLTDIIFVKKNYATAILGPKNLHKKA